MKTASENQKTLIVMALVLAGLFIFQSNSMAAGVVITVTAIDGTVTRLNPGDVLDTPGSAEGEIQTFDEGVEATIPRVEERRQPILEGKRVPEPSQPSLSEASTFTTTEGGGGLD